MSILDLDAVNVADLALERSPQNRLPTYVRKRGCYPNFDDLLVGDVVLFAPRNPGITQQHIQNNQRSSFEELHAIWTHVGIYIGDGSVCEATLKKVKEGSLFDYLDKYLVKIRRIPVSDAHTRYKIALRLMRRLGLPYSPREIFNHVLDSVNGSWRNRKTNLFELRNRQAYTCSSAVYESIFEATGSSPLNEDLNRVCPADFSISERLVDVNVGWVRLPLHLEPRSTTAPEL